MSMTTVGENAAIVAPTMIINPEKLTTVGIETIPAEVIGTTQEPGDDLVFVPGVVEAKDWDMIAELIRNEAAVSGIDMKDIAVFADVTNTLLFTVGSNGSVDSWDRFANTESYETLTSGDCWDAARQSQFATHLSSPVAEKTLSALVGGDDSVVASYNSLASEVMGIYPLTVIRTGTPEAKTMQSVYTETGYASPENVPAESDYFKYDGIIFSKYADPYVVVDPVPPRVDVIRDILSDPLLEVTTTTSTTTLIPLSDEAATTIDETTVAEIDSTTLPPVEPRKLLDASVFMKEVTEVSEESSTVIEVTETTGTPFSETVATSSTPKAIVYIDGNMNNIQSVGNFDAETGLDTQLLLRIVYGGESDEASTEVTEDYCKMESSKEFPDFCSSDFCSEVAGSSSKFAFFALVGLGAVLAYILYTKNKKTNDPVVTTQAPIDVEAQGEESSSVDEDEYKPAPDAVMEANVEPTSAPEQPTEVDQQSSVKSVQEEAAVQPEAQLEEPSLSEEGENQVSADIESQVEDSPVDITK